MSTEPEFVPDEPREPVTSIDEHTAAERLVLALDGFEGPLDVLLTLARDHAFGAVLRFESMDELARVLLGVRCAAFEPGVLVAGKMPVPTMATNVVALEQLPQGRAVGSQRGADLNRRLARVHAWTSRSTAAASVNKRSSSNAGASSWSPTGNLGRSARAGVGAQGTLSPAIPARLAGSV